MPMEDFKLFNSPFVCLFQKYPIHLFMQFLNVSELYGLHAELKSKAKVQI